MYSHQFWTTTGREEKKGGGRKRAKKKSKSACVHGHENDAARDHRRIIHRVHRHGQIRRQREDDRHEERPRDAVEIHRPAEPSVAEVEGPGLELHLGVMLVDAAERDGDDI